MPQGGVRGQNLGHLRFFSCFYFSYVKTGTALFRVDFLSVTSDCRVQYVPEVKMKDIMKDIFFAFLSFVESFVVEQGNFFLYSFLYEFRNDFLEGG